MNWKEGVVPSLHHRKERWTSEHKNVAKHPLNARTGWLFKCYQRKTTPVARRRLLRGIFLMSQPPLLAVMQGGDYALIPPLPQHQKGAATVYFVLFTVVALGFLALATDVGRMYLIQGELQTAADAAALAAATQLTGVANAITYADDQVTASFDSTTGNDNRFNLRQNSIETPAGLIATRETSYFATREDAIANLNSGQTGSVDWGTGVYPKYVRVQITAQAPVIFAQLLTRAVDAPPSITVSSVAGVSSPMCTACGIDNLAVIDPSVGEDPINFGFELGQFYTLYLNTMQQTPNNPSTPQPLADTLGAVPYAILNHVPGGAAELDPDGIMFETGAVGIARTENITAETIEVLYPDLAGNVAAPVGQSILCGLNTRFGVDPSENACSMLNNGEFIELAPFFAADSDVGAETYAAGLGLQDFATEYDGSNRRVLTVPVIDAIDSVNVLGFRQFLLEMSSTVVQGIDTSLTNGAFRVQYIGTLVPVRCGGISGVCTTTNGGIGRVVLH
jgi:Flp pilus assembly protein TadG